MELAHLPGRVSDRGGARMNKLYPDSLASTLDAVNEACLFRCPVSESHREQVAEGVAGRQAKPGSYASMFAPTDDDYNGGIRLFTGERVRSLQSRDRAYPWLRSCRAWAPKWRLTARCHGYTISDKQ